jgi:hypothetical protein
VRYSTKISMFTELLAVPCACGSRSVATWLGVQASGHEVCWSVAAYLALTEREVQFSATCQADMIGSRFNR